MKGDDPEFIEATHFALQFFPESTNFISMDTGLDGDLFLGAMRTADYHADYSCYPFRSESDPDIGLVIKGGLEGNSEEIYYRLLKHSHINPHGRVVVVFDAIGRTSWSTENIRPLICDSYAVGKHLSELNCFGQCRDVLFIFESGAAILVDHGDRVHWSQSLI